ncbi:hypothetical protein CCH79_00008797 [Gambusia affinis]|uniref:Uncharacterized protein n=1 Tax=Gambusia affinis TaxID=33528 RepID=A0A315UUX1_GAMAF|nr:hypothetical protein CCH79_00008797 [Gambusia affinis]
MKCSLYGGKKTSPHEGGAHLHFSSASSLQDAQKLTPGLLKQISVVVQQDRIFKRISDTLRVAISGCSLGNPVVSVENNLLKVTELRGFPRSFSSCSAWQGDRALVKVVRRSSFMSHSSRTSVFNVAEQRLRSLWNAVEKEPKMSCPLRSRWTRDSLCRLLARCPMVARRSSSSAPSLLTSSAPAGSARDCSLGNSTLDSNTSRLCQTKDVEELLESEGVGSKANKANLQRTVAEKQEGLSHQLIASACHKSIQKDID